ncbi:hypothetical protein NQ317_000367 [Molorchus minor]|uniref:guanylate cyclase n=1 Tax=Molorchus minor TaxID=1323400 RepID=A0ABQ9JMM8_9CUCU|nr:hypothetical protein NQ317_000367 [Molorchus minor]
MDGQFLVRQIYDDELTYNLISAATEVLEIPANTILELFGKTFFEFCQDSGYDKILQVLGATPRDFLQWGGKLPASAPPQTPDYHPGTAFALLRSDVYVHFHPLARLEVQESGSYLLGLLHNLDALHDHLGTLYPGMRAPSFRCTEGQVDGGLILHYYSDRPGLEYIVIGIVKAVASKLHGTEVDMSIIKTRKNCDHVQFLITEKTSEGKAHIPQFDQIKTLSLGQKVSPATFCKVFPFHVMFDKHLRIIQTGYTLSRVISELTTNCRLGDILETVRPHLELTFENILAHINTVYVLKTRSEVMNANIPLEYRYLRLKGQMLYIPETNLVIFLCYPSVMNLGDLIRRGLYISDIPLHDATRDLVLMSERFEADYKLTRNLELLTDKLQQTYRELDAEKKKTDQYVY